MGRGIIEAKHDTHIYIEVSEHIEVSERHHDQTLPIPFGLLKKKLSQYSHTGRSLTVGEGQRGNIIYYDTHTI